MILSLFSSSLFFCWRFVAFCRFFVAFFVAILSLFLDEKRKELHVEIRYLHFKNYRNLKKSSKNSNIRQK
jgi:hypothetical protein